MKLPTQITALIRSDKFELFTFLLAIVSMIFYPIALFLFEWIMPLWMLILPLLLVSAWLAIVLTAWNRDSKQLEIIQALITLHERINLHKRLLLEEQKNSENKSETKNE